MLFDGLCPLTLKEKYIIAAIAGIENNQSDCLQLPMNLLAGKLKPDANAEDIAMKVLYKPMAKPSFKPNRSRICAGMATLSIPMAELITIEPANSPAAPKKERSSEPENKQARQAMIMVFCLNLLKRRPARGDITANISKENVVIKPEMAGFNSNSLVIAGTNGPTLLIGARIARATNTSPIR